jgi:RNA polymerase sigma factor (sigma-70 family)
MNIEAATVMHFETFAGGGRQALLAGPVTLCGMLQGDRRQMAGAEADLRLSRRAVKGDDRAFAAIFDRYNQRLYRYCLAIVGNPQDAQDALQNTMVKVLRTLPGEERPIELKPWLYRIAHNESIELLRRRRDTRQLDDELAAPGSGLVDKAASRERLRRLISDLDELPERQRGALVMRELGGLDFAEIGAALGTSSEVARQTLYEARLSLRGMDEGRRMSCETVTKALSGGDGRVIRRRDLRAHLHDCTGCRGFREEIDARELDLVALSPLPAVVGARLLERLLGGHGAGGGAAAAIGGGAAQSLGSAVALKAVATVAVVAAIGAGAAYQGGLVGAGRASDHSPQPAQAVGSDAATHAPFAGHGGRYVSSAAGAEHAAGVGGDGRVGVLPAGSHGREKAPSPTAGEVAGPAEDGAAANSTTGNSDDVDASAPDLQGDSSAPPHGTGHGEQPPVATEHGNQTAAEHRGSEHGQQTAAEHKAEHGPASEGHPAHPAHPAHPVSPGAEPELPPAGAPGTAPEAEAPSESSAEEETTPGRGIGKGHGPERE